MREIGQQQPPPAQPLAGSLRWTLASLSLTMLLSALGTSIANVGLPALTQAFAASLLQVQWVVLAYLLAITTLIVSVGRLGDLVGRRRLMLVGIGVFTLASVWCAAAPTLSILIAARAVQGLGAAIMMALTLALVGESIPRERTGSALGLLGSMSAVGTALGPALGGLLLHAFDWRALFVVNLPLGVLAWLLVWRCLPADRAVVADQRTRFDVVGTLLLGLTLAAYALAMTLGRGHIGVANIALLVATVVGVGLFVLVEARANSPLIRLSILRNPLLSAGFATSALVTTVVMATLVVGPFYLSGALKLDAAQVGLIMAAGPVAAALSGLPAGRAVDRFGSQRMAASGLVAMLIGCALLALLPLTAGVAGYVAPLVVITAGYAWFQAANNTAVMTAIGADQRGVVAGLLNLSRNLGLITGASLMGVVFAWGAATTDVATAQPEALATGLRVAFAVASLLVIAALAIMMAGRSWRPAETRSPNRAPALSGKEMATPSR
jgi:EmrB/QacA subfamily drug resistance transporter